MGKQMRLVFKGGQSVLTPYSYKVMQELIANIGKDQIVEAKNFTVNTKELIGVFYEAPAAAE